MSRRLMDLLLALRVAADLTMVVAAWLLAYALRFSGLLPVSKGVPDFLLYFKMTPFVAVIWFMVFAGSGFYRRSRRHRSAFVEALDILQCCALATMAFIAFSYVYEEYRYSRVVMGIFAALHPWLIITGRSLVRKALRVYRRRTPARRTLVIGAGETLRHAMGLLVTGDLTRSEILGVMIIGDDATAKASRDEVEAMGYRCLPVPSDWPAFFSAQPTATVVLALPHRAYDFVEAHLDRIADQVPDVRLIPDLMRFSRFAAGVDVLGGTPVVTLNESPLAGLGSVVKRIMDITGATAALLLFSPVMAVVATLVRLSSPGPILYRQERMGLDGQTFGMLKFRSMRVDAEAKTGAVWAQAGDDRTTAIGKWLRRTSLDELPQFFNVLRGAMSLVGPRPERPVFVEQFRRQVPGYYLRHKTKAGITGWAQVNGWRGNTSIEKRIECDLYYIQNWSLWFDLKIIFLTIFRGFIHKNAY